MHELSLLWLWQLMHRCQSCTPGAHALQGIRIEGVPYAAYHSMAYDQKLQYCG
jgi:hypothetical protein